jgi:hypothetical protein
MSKSNNDRKEQSIAERDAILAKARQMRSWSELIETVHVSADIAAALATGRPELLKLARPRALDEADCAALFKLLAVLIETNQALIAHAQETAKMTRDIATMLKGTVAMFGGVEHFANFRHNQDEDEA